MDPQGGADDLERRVDAVEHEVAQLREDLTTVSADAAAARVLAAGADRDVSEVRAELRAHIQVLNALRETQVEHGRRMEASFAAVDASFAAVDANFAAVARQLDTVHTGIRHITDLLESGPN